MKQKWSYEKVDLLLVAPRTQNNGSLRQSLNDLDFREIRTGFDLNDIHHALQTRAPDLLITDCQLPCGDVYGLILDIRAHKVGTNPFMAIMVTTWKPSVELVHEGVDSGADDLIGCSNVPAATSSPASLALMASCGSGRGGGPEITEAPRRGSNIPAWHGQ